MTDRSLGSAAWIESPGAYAARRQRDYDGVPRRFSCYVEMSDGVELAVDVYLPAPAAESARFPAVLAFTPYYRRYEKARDASPGTETCPGLAQYRDFFPGYGYAFVAVDIRGTGASFGARTGMRSPEERQDFPQVVAWVAAQAWCTGAVGITGTSYMGAAADFAAGSGHPAIKAVMPVSSAWDTWGDMLYPGGLLVTGMVGGYGRVAQALDNDERDVLRGFPAFDFPGLAGPAPVDADKGGLRLSRAVAGHAANYDMMDFVTQLDARGAGLRHDPGFTTDTMAPKTFAAGIPHALLHYGVSGWLDGAGHAAGAISRFEALPNPAKRLLIGPWDHGVQTHVSPERRFARPRFELLAETLRFFDQHVAGRSTGLEHERPVHYFTLVEEAWHAADRFPPSGTAMRSWALGADGTLQDEADAAEDADAFQVDHSAGTGRDTRYARLAGRTVDQYYPDWHERDDGMLCWTTPPMDAEAEITGTPWADLWLTCDTPDAALVLYLEDIAPDGSQRYITEECLRASFRAVRPAPPLHPHPGPYHPFTAESRLLLMPGEVMRVQIALHPTSWLLRPGHRLRLALAGADRDNLARVPYGVSPLLHILRGGAHASVLHVPEAPRSPGPV